MHRRILREGRKEGVKGGGGQEGAIDCRLCTCRTARRSARQNQMSSFGKRLAGSLTHLGARATPAVSRHYLHHSSEFTTAQSEIPLKRAHAKEMIVERNVQASVTRTRGRRHRCNALFEGIYKEAFLLNHEGVFSLFSDFYHIQTIFLPPKNMFALKSIFYHAVAVETGCFPGHSVVVTETGQPLTWDTPHPLLFLKTSEWPTATFV